MSLGSTDSATPAALTEEVWAYVALGSNQGDSLTLLRAVVQRLTAFSDQPLLRSSVWQSAPIDCPPGSPLFLNAVVGLQPRAHETPESLLHKLQALERELGRALKKVLNEPRRIDLDLLSFGRCRRQKPELTLPHPRAHRRRFVLAPWSEIAPSLVPPGWSASIGRRVQEVGTEQAIERLSDSL